MTEVEFLGNSFYAKVVSMNEILVKDVSELIPSTLEPINTDYITGFAEILRPFSDILKTNIFEWNNV